MGLIPMPVLDGRNGEQIAAQAIARTSGGLTVERILSMIETLREVIPLIESGALAPPICPELTSANPSDPHTVLLEAIAWIVDLQKYNINQTNPRIQIEFARMFGIELRGATLATTTLTFATNGQATTIPAGTKVQNAGGTIVFETTEEAIVAEGVTSVEVAAQNIEAGYTQLTINVLTQLVDQIAFVTGVTNASLIDSGTNAETVAEALTRARSFQRRAMRLVTAQDLEEMVLQDVMLGSGIVKAFPFVRNGDWEVMHVGETTLIVMTKTGLTVTEAEKAVIRTKLVQAVGNQFIYVLDPQYVTFNVTASVKATSSLTPQATITAAVEQNLRDFYLPSASNFGRRIAQSEIIKVIQGTDGVDRIVTDVSGDLVLTPTADIVLAPYQLPKVVSVAITVVP